MPGRPSLGDGESGYGPPAPKGAKKPVPSRPRVGGPSLSDHSNFRTPKSGALSKAAKALPGGKAGAAFKASKAVTEGVKGASSAASGGFRGAGRAAAQGMKGAGQAASRQMVALPKAALKQMAKQGIKAGGKAAFTACIGSVWCGIALALAMAMVIVFALVFFSGVIGVFDTDDTPSFSVVSSGGIGGGGGGQLIGGSSGVVVNELIGGELDPTGGLGNCGVDEREVTCRLTAAHLNAAIIGRFGAYTTDSNLSTLRVYVGDFPESDGTEPVGQDPCQSLTELVSQLELSGIDVQSKDDVALCHQLLYGLAVWVRVSDAAEILESKWQEISARQSHSWNWLAEENSDRWEKWDILARYGTGLVLQPPSAEGPYTLYGFQYVAAVLATRSSVNGGMFLPVYGNSIPEDSGGGVSGFKFCSDREQNFGEAAQSPRADIDMKITLLEFFPCPSSISRTVGWECAGGPIYVQVLDLDAPEFEDYFGAPPPPEIETETDPGLIRDDGTVATCPHGFNSHDWYVLNLEAAAGVLPEEQLFELAELVVQYPSLATAHLNYEPPPPPPPLEAHVDHGNFQPPSPGFLLRVFDDLDLWNLSAIEREDSGAGMVALGAALSDRCVSSAFYDDDSRCSTFAEEEDRPDSDVLLRAAFATVWKGDNQQYPLCDRQSWLRDAHKCAAIEQIVEEFGSDAWDEDEDGAPCPAAVLSLSSGGLCRALVGSNLLPVFQAAGWERIEYREDGSGELGRFYIVRDRFGTRRGIYAECDTTNALSERSTELTTISARQNIGVKAVTVNRCVAEAVLWVLEASRERAGGNGGFYVISGYRTDATQRRFRVEHCWEAGGLATRPTDVEPYLYVDWVDSLPPTECSPATAIPGTSYHQQGIAIDFRPWGTWAETPNDPNAEPWAWLKDQSGYTGLRNRFDLHQEAWHWSPSGR